MSGQSLLSQQRRARGRDYCGGKLATGEFDWVLSRIEQDEGIRGMT